MASYAQIAAIGFVIFCFLLGITLLVHGGINITITHKQKLK